MSQQQVGISGLSLYVPPYRVNLEDWCDWTDNQLGKIQAVVGSSFRMRGPEHNAYTMAATAVLRLIDAFEVDPHRVRYLALGTESSTDNSAGAVIVRGMIDDALRARGKEPLARGCEVPEFKHACLGGVYALKSAVRYLMADGEGLPGDRRLLRHRGVRPRQQRRTDAGSRRGRHAGGGEPQAARGPSRG